MGNNGVSHVIICCRRGGLGALRVVADMKELNKKDQKMIEERRSG
jgi:hypothetical protein